MSKHGINNENKKSKKNIVLDDYDKKDTKVKKAKEPKYNKKRKNRKILSYENIPIKEYSDIDEKVNKRILKKTLLIFSVLITIVIVVFVFANRNKLSWDNFTTWVSESVFQSTKGDEFPTDILGTTVSKGNFTLIGGRPCYASDTSYVELSDSAGKIINTQLSFSDPIVRNTSNYSIVYSAGGTGYIVNDVKETKHKGNTQNGIYSADVNDSGYYCIVSQGSEYLSVLTAYDKENKKMFEYSFADYYITCVSINPNGDGAVCFGVTSQNGTEQTKIYVLDFKETKPVKEYDISESLIYDSYFLSSNKLIAVSNNSIFTIDLDKDKPDVTDYNSRKLTTYSFNKETNALSVALSRSNDGRNCDIIVFDSSGEVDYTIKSEYRVDSISTYKGNLGILSSGDAYILEEDGTVSGKCSVGNDARSILLYSSDKAYVLGISEIRTIEIDE